MNNLFLVDEWKVIQEGFDDSINEIAESITSLGNGHMGFRGNFEEDFSGSTLKGTYIAGVYYPDKTKVGWWKIGYPEYFAKILNACDFISLHLEIDGELIDINKLNVKDFKRVLDMKNGLLLRSFTVSLTNGKSVSIQSKRFVSMAEKEIGAIQYSITPVDDDVNVKLISYVNGDVRNADSNYDEMFWEKCNVTCSDNTSGVTLRTKKTGFLVSSTAVSNTCLDGDIVTSTCECDDLEASNKFEAKISKGQTLRLDKFFAVTTNRDYDNAIVEEKSLKAACDAADKGYDKLYDEHCNAWSEIWKHSDIKITGDDKAQQGIRFNIFQLNQTYTGKDSRLNVGPKGFTGEKYGGSTYWDTESYCLPFYLSTAREQVSKNLLIYRYNHLQKAKENAQKLGLKGALYPMVTMNGEECHNEWEITFEEIHRNAAITHAIYNYVNYTGDRDYLAEYGIYVLYETSRFWASRVNYNPRKKKYMILGVTGPNEYENNVNNNYHTNKMAAFSMRYTVEVANELKKNNPESYAKAVHQLHITDKELDKFTEISKDMYLPYIEEFDVYGQQDGFMDKDQLSVDDLLPSDRPLNQNWSWDRILRSIFIKQADVLQCIYNLPEEYTLDEKRRNFDFYEPKTVHESSLSPCIYSIIACEVGYLNKGYELYLRASRLDLDNYNNDTEDGLHITSMAGTWMSIVHGFGGMRIKDNSLHLNPTIPTAWQEYSFRLYFRKTTLNVTVTKSYVDIKIEQGDSIDLYVFGRKYNITEQKKIKI